MIQYIRYNYDKVKGWCIMEKPLVAIDLAEHAYFGDYGFCREEYIKAAILHLDLSKISDFVKERRKKR